jgi:multidrug efflux system outer membrane protein
MAQNRFNRILLLAFIHASLSPAFANGSRPPPAPSPEPPNSSTFEVNPATLREQLMDENIDVLLAAHRVAVAKTQVNFARSSLLPTINLGTVLMAAGQPNFLLSSVEVMLPFLLPSKWFELKRDKLQLDADKEAFKLVQLNMMANTWSIYSAILTDQLLLDQMKIDADDWKMIEALTIERFEFGLADENEVALAQSQRALAFLRVEKLKVLLSDELALLRQALGLPIQRKMRIARSSLAELSQENWSVDRTLKASMTGSSELAQLEFLTSAAKADRWARIFGFIIGVSASQQAGAGSELRSSLSQFDAGGRMSFSANQFPNIQLASRNIESIEIRKEEVRREFTRLVEAVKEKLPSIKNQVLLAAEAEAAMRISFERTLERYQYGAGVSLIDVLRSRIGIQEATTEKVRAMNDLNLARISLSRILRVGEFAKINGCKYPVLSNQQRGAISRSGQQKICTATPPN